MDPEHAPLSYYATVNVINDKQQAKDAFTWDVSKIWWKARHVHHLSRPVWTFFTRNVMSKATTVWQLEMHGEIFNFEFFINFIF